MRRNQISLDGGCTGIWGSLSPNLRITSYMQSEMSQMTRNMDIKYKIYAPNGWREGGMEN